MKPSEQIVSTIYVARAETFRIRHPDVSFRSHFSVPYVDWGMQNPSVLFLTVAKQVEIDIATEGRITWLHRGMSLSRSQ